MASQHKCTKPNKEPGQEDTECQEAEKGQKDYFIKLGVSHGALAEFGGLFPRDGGVVCGSLPVLGGISS